MQTEPNTPAAGGRDHLIHEQQLAAALRELLQQIDLGDYRDHQGRPARESPAYCAAQGLVEHFDLTHDALDLSSGQAEVRTASPRDTPPEYNTWHTGP